MKRDRIHNGGRNTAAAVVLLFVVGSSLHLGQHGHCAGHDPGGGAPSGDESGCLACQVLAGGLVETSGPLLPLPASEFVSLVVPPERAACAERLPCVFARGPPA